MVKADPFYTSAQSMWEMPPHLAAIYAEAAVVILKGDANYRRLLGDLHWPYNTNFHDYAASFWPGSGLVCLRTMKSGVALGITEAKRLVDIRLFRPDIGLQKVMESESCQ